MWDVPHENHHDLPADVLVFLRAHLWDRKKNHNLTGHTFSVFAFVVF